MIKKYKDKFSYNKGETSSVDRKFNVLDTSSAPSVSEINLNIPNGLVVDEFEQPNTDDNANFYTPYFSNGIELNFAGADLSIANEYFNDVIYPLYVQALQYKVNFKVDISKSDMKKALLSITRALSLYYTVGSILECTKDATNRNSGLYYVRRLITSDVLIMHEVLESRIKGMYIPTPFFEVIRYMFAIHCLSDMPNTPYIQNTFMHTFLGNGEDKNTESINAKIGFGVYQAVITELDENSLLLARIARISESWLVKEIPKPFGKPVFSNSFKTWWMNSGLAYSDDGTATKYFPQIDSSTSMGFYTIIDNNVDGTIPALWSVYNKATSRNEPGIISFPGKIATLKSSLNYYNKTDMSELTNGSSAIFANKHWIVKPGAKAFTTHTYPVSGITKAVGFTLSAIKSTSTRFQHRVFDVDNISFNLRNFIPK